MNTISSLLSQNLSFLHYKYREKRLTWLGDGWETSCFSNSSRWAKVRPHCSHTKEECPPRRLKDSEKGDDGTLPEGLGFTSSFVLLPKSTPDSLDPWLTTESEKCEKKTKTKQ